MPSISRSRDRAAATSASVSCTRASSMPTWTDSQGTACVSSGRRRCACAISLSARSRSPRCSAARADAASSSARVTNAPSRREPAVALASARKRVGVGVRAACGREQRALAERGDLRVHRTGRGGRLDGARRVSRRRESSSPARWCATPRATRVVGSQTPPGGTASYAAATSSSIRSGPVAAAERVQEAPPGSSGRQAPLRCVGPTLGVGRAAAQRVHPCASGTGRDGGRVPAAR